MKLKQHWEPVGILAQSLSMTAMKRTGESWLCSIGVLFVVRMLLFVYPVPECLLIGDFAMHAGRKTVHSLSMKVMAMKCPVKSSDPCGDPQGQPCTALCS